MHKQFTEIHDLSVHYTCILFATFLCEHGFTTKNYTISLKNNFYNI